MKQVRYNAIVEAATTIQGSAAEAAGTFDGQMKQLSRELKDLKEDVGKAFNRMLPHSWARCPRRLGSPTAR